MIIKNNELPHVPTVPMMLATLRVCVLFNNFGYSKLFTEGMYNFVRFFHTISLEISSPISSREYLGKILVFWAQGPS